MKFRCATSRSTNVTVKTYILLFSSNKGYYNYQYFTVEQIKKKTTVQKILLAVQSVKYRFTHLTKIWKFWIFRFVMWYWEKHCLGKEPVLNILLLILAE